MDTPDWISSKIDSINNSKTTTEEVLEGMQEDVYTIGKTDFTSGFWSSFSKYYVIGENQKWNAQFNLNINPSAPNTYKNFALIITSDADRGAADYKEYGAIRFDATGDSAAYNSQWGSAYNILRSDTPAHPAALARRQQRRCQRAEAGRQGDAHRRPLAYRLLRGEDHQRHRDQDLPQPNALKNLNTDATNTNIRCFLVHEGS
jgi:hypothetical protein